MYKTPVLNSLSLDAEMLFSDFSLIIIFFNSPGDASLINSGYHCNFLRGRHINITPCSFGLASNCNNYLYTKYRID